MTTVAPQSLMLLNDEFMQQQAAAFAERLVKEAGSDPQAQIRRAYRPGVQRRPASARAAWRWTISQRQSQRLRAARSRLTFRPDVPFSLEDGVLATAWARPIFLAARGKVGATTAAVGAAATRESRRSTRSAARSRCGKARRFATASCRAG